MDYEKKYNEALERARKIREDILNNEIIGFPGQVTDIFPELCESEDERLMREFNDWLCEEIECRTNDLRDEKDRRTLNMLCYVLTKVKDWLEKQKEQEHICDSAQYEEGFKTGLEIGLRKQKEQKPELVQQPPITYTYNSNASRDERLKAALLALLNSDLLKIKEGGYFTKQDLIDWVERIPTEKPAEWSEEDERNARYLENLCDTEILRGSSTRSEYEVKCDAKEWLASFREKFNFQAKMEWSEEDKQWLSEVYFAIDHSMYSDEEKRAMKKYIDSLRPGWKPTEEQMEALDKAIPVCLGVAGPDEIAPLESLYEQLKKL